MKPLDLLLNTSAPTFRSGLHLQRTLSQVAIGGYVAQFGTFSRLRLRGRTFQEARQWYQRWMQAKSATEETQLFVGVGEYNLSELGNAQRLVATDQGMIRYCPDLDQWLVWDGQRWKQDTSCDVERLAKLVIRGLYREPSDQDNDSKRDVLIEWELRSETAKMVRNMLFLARSDPGIRITPGELDRDRWLLNCANGVLTLREGEVHAPQLEAYVTRLCPVAYVPNATVNLWDTFLQRILPDEELRRYVQKAAGYSLTGLTSEEVSFLSIGPSESGKSTLTGALQATWGPDYTTSADPEMWMVRHRKGPRDDLADLAGNRLVVSQETDDGATLSAALLKSAGLSALG